MNTTQSKTLMQRIPLIFCAILIIVGLLTAQSSFAYAQGQWVAGDFHSHTTISDGSYSAKKVAKNALFYGLDWYAATDHGGVMNSRHRWRTILSEGSDSVYQNRETIMQFNGFELNVPGHEHASIGMIGDDTRVREQLAIFAYLYDCNDRSTDKELNSKMKAIVKETDIAKNTINDHTKALEAAVYLQDRFAKSSYFLPNHPSRKLCYTAKELRELNDAAPDVFFGMELVPGHQKASFRGGFSFYTYNDEKLGNLVTIPSNGASSIEQMVTKYIRSNQKLQKPLGIDDKTIILTSLALHVPKQRTYGGADYMLAKVGGLWDSMLTEGRHFWVFGNSDFHSNKGAEADFWPGEYVKNYIYVQDVSYQGILDGMRSGNAFVVMGDLIDALDFHIITQDGTTKTMGETIVTDGNDVTMTIRFMSPAANHAKGDGRSNMKQINDIPVVDHIDVIAGEVTGIFEDYTVDSIDTVQVIRTLNMADFEEDADGYHAITFTIPKTQKDMYYRLRGTNQAVDAEGQTDAQGNPLIDTPWDAMKGTNNAAEAFNDLWFYTNPIFINVQ